MPVLLERIGPIKGDSLRVSRRIANGLKTGTGVSDYAALAKCDLIWIVVPELALDHVSEELAAAISLEGKTVVLCDMIRDSFWPSPLRTAGARLATLNSIPESGERAVRRGGPSGKRSGTAPVTRARTPQADRAAAGGQAALPLRVASERRPARAVDRGSCREYACRGIFARRSHGRRGGYRYEGAAGVW